MQSECMLKSVLGFANKRVIADKIINIEYEKEGNLLYLLCLDASNIHVILALHALVLMFTF